MCPTSELLHRLRWMPLYEYFKYRKAVLTFKFLQGDTPDAMKNVFRYVRDVATHTTRSSVSNKLYVPKVKSTSFKRSFMYSASVLWNDLSEELRNSRNIETFKKNYVFNYFTNRV